MFRKTYGYILNHPTTTRGYWGDWYYKRRYMMVLRRLLKLCESEDATLLELGCGKGFYAKYLQERGSKCSYVGCDIDEKSIKSAYRGDRIDYVKCDVQRLPFKDKSVPVVLCSEVLEHLTSPYTTLEAITRIATETFIVTFPEESLLSTFKDGHPEHVSTIEKKMVAELLSSKGSRGIQISHIFSSFIPCGVLEFLHFPRNNLTQAIVGTIDKLLKKTIPLTLVPHKTILIEAEAPA